MPAFHVTCAECGGEKWPSLPERPARYTCVLCAMVPAEKRDKRREQRRGNARTTNLGRSQRRSGPPAPGPAA